MLIFLDQSKNIKVLRVGSDNSGTISRTRLGVVSKNKLEIGDELRTQLTSNEIEETERVIETYRSVDAMQLDLDIIRFPQIARAAVQYISSNNADDLQKRLIISSLMECMRVIRSVERAEVMRPPSPMQASH